jgi:hypothetical protein
VVFPGTRRSKTLDFVSRLADDETNRSFLAGKMNIPHHQGDEK